MRHLIYCTECGKEFEKKTASTVCPECLANPKPEPKPEKKVKK
jgi:NMD protein affecting ribosome stability and mRNA decay